MVRIGFIYPGHESLGIEYLSANLKINGFQTKLFLDPVLFCETHFLQNKALASIFSFHKIILKKIVEFKPDLFCFSVTTDNYVWACEWARKIKQNFEVPIIFGGVHATSVPERIIKEPFVDYVCVGEGDFAVIELAESIRSKKPNFSIPNIWSKNNGTIYSNDVRPPIADLNTLPFPDKGLYYETAPVFRYGYLISSSRGCPFSCTYCCNNIYNSLYERYGGFIRKRNADNVIEELVIARAKYNPKFIHFVDEVFNYDYEWLKGFLEKYIKEVKLPFSCYCYPNFTDKALIELLKKAGCFKVQIGLQTVDETKRAKVFKRGSDAEKIAKTIDYFRDAGVYITSDTIFGFPEESEKELISVCEFYNEHTPNHCENFWLRYYPKTQITQWALANKYITSEINEKIEKGEYSTGLVRQPGHSKINPYASKLMLFLRLYPFLGKKIRTFILKGKFYRLLPEISQIFSLIILRIFNRPRYDLNTLRTAKKYLYFCRVKIFGGG
jgi:hypothetical protein